MNENINLTKILKDCPKGTKLYSILHGDVEYEGISDKGTYRVEFKAEDGNIYGVTPDGRHLSYFNGDCILFPSKEQRDWSKFTAPWYKKDKFDPKTFKPFDKVIVRDSFKDKWNCSFFSYICDDDNYFPYITTNFNTGYSFCVPFNDETKHLLGTTDEAPEFYKYWD